MNPLTVEMNEITKSFSKITVLNKVNFALRLGEIHALLGENGAGKSTLMKILRGIYQPDQGKIKINGKVVRFNSPSDARASGISMVFQEFSLVPTLTIAQNVFLTREFRNKFGLFDEKECERRTRQVFEEMGVNINPHLTVSQLSTGYRQLTEIASALSQEASILIFDEPTASLTQAETESLFEFMRGLKAKGISMIYISHRMEEIFKIADRITVLRDGRNVITDEVENLTIEKVIEHILGRKSEAGSKKPFTSSVQADKPLLEVKNLKCVRTIKNVSFRLNRGEVLGLAGLMGSGRTELVQAVFGINPILSGEIWINDQPIKTKSPEDSMRANIALIPEDRRVQGLIMEHSIKDNLILPLIKLKRLANHKYFIDRHKSEEVVQISVENLKIRSDSIHKVVRYLSGGNQQKVVIAKWLSANPDILLMDEPTAGVDIGTKGEIIDIIRSLAREGKGIIFISSELQEMIAVCDRIIVIKDGTVDCELSRNEIPSEDKLHHILQGVQ